MHKQGTKWCPSSHGFASRLPAVPVQELLPRRTCKPRSFQGIMLCRPGAIPCPSCLLQHIQLPHQYLLLHPRANHPFLVASNLRSSTLGASTTYRNGPHFYVKCVQSSFKYSLNQAFIIETAGGKSWKRISPLSFYSAIHFVQAGAEVFCVSQ